MPRSRDPRPARITLAATLIALLAHAGLLMLPLPDFQPEQHRGTRPPLTVELPGQRPEPAPQAPLEAAPPERQHAERPETVAARSDTPASAALEDELTLEQREPQPALSSEDEDRPNEAAPATAGQLRSRLLEEAAALGRSLEQTGGETSIDYHPVPELPGRPGWLNPHVGRVAPSIDRWRASDGGRSARIVTGSGRVVCVRTRASTIDEIFNPWRSSAVGMMRDCGRERPKPDEGDPWLRRPAPPTGED